MAILPGRRPSNGLLGKTVLLSILSLVLLAACTPGSLISWGSGWSATAAGDGVVYVGTRDGEVLALDANKSGKLRPEEQIIWRYSPVDEQSLSGFFGAPAVGRTHIYVGDVGDSDGENARLLALKKDRKAGEETRLDINGGEWVKQIEGAIVGGPTLAEEEGLVLVGSDDGNLYAYKTTEDNPGRLAWRFPAKGEIWSPPAVGDGAVYFGSMDRHVYALALGEELNQAERLLWKYKTGGAVVGKPLLLEGMVIVGSFDGKLYAIDSKEGDLLWSFEGDDWFWAGPVSDGERIYAANLRGTVYALDKSGNRSWTFPAESPVVSRPLVIGDELVVGTDEGKLHLLDARSGDSLDIFNGLLGQRIKAPLSNDGPIVFAGVEGSTVIGLDVERWVEIWRVSTEK